MQLNAFVSLIVSLIFVSVVFPVIVVNNLILFLAVGVAVLFVGFVLWGFVNNGNIKLEGKVLTGMGVLVFISVIAAVFWATGAFPFLWDWLEKFYKFAFLSNGSEGFWTNFLVVALVVVAVGAVLKKTGK